MRLGGSQDVLGPEGVAAGVLGVGADDVQCGEAEVVGGPPAVAERQRLVVAVPLDVQ